MGIQDDPAYHEHLCAGFHVAVCLLKCRYYNFVFTFQRLAKPIIFQSDYIIFCREGQHRQVSFLSLLLFSHPCQPLMLSHFPSSYPNPCELIAHCGCISLMDNNTEHLFMHLLASPPPPCTPGKRNDISGS